MQISTNAKTIYFEPDEGGRLMFLRQNGNEKTDFNVWKVETFNWETGFVTCYDDRTPAGPVAHRNESEIVIRKRFQINMNTILGWGYSYIVSKEQLEKEKAPDIQD